MSTTTVWNHEAFDPLYPETFPWNKTTTPHLSTLSVRIKNEIMKQLKWSVEMRSEVPGLRLALKMIAKHAEVKQEDG